MTREQRTQEGRRWGEGRGRGRKRKNWFQRSLFMESTAMACHWCFRSLCRIVAVKSKLFTHAVNVLASERRNKILADSMNSTLGSINTSY